MYLIDSNLIAEILLRQERSQEVKNFLNHCSPRDLFLTDFSLFSIGIILLRRKLHGVFNRFVADMLTVGGIQLIRLSIQEMESITLIAQKFNLDFDDAYQYAAAERYGLTIVSFDADFDRTEKGRQTPARAMTA